MNYLFQLRRIPRATFAVRTTSGGRASSFGIYVPRGLLSAVTNTLSLDDQNVWEINISLLNLVS